VFERRACHAHGSGCNLRARSLEEVERDLEALTFISKTSLHWNACVLHDDRAGVGCAQTDFPLGAACRDGQVAALEDERGDLVVELREHERHVGLAAVRHVNLLAVQDVAVAVPARRCADGRQVRSCVGLRERNRRECSLFTREIRKIEALLLVAAEAEQRANREHRRLHRRRKTGAAPGELLGNEGARDGACAAAAVLGRDRVRGESRRCSLGEEAGWVLLALVVLRGDGSQLSLCEFVRRPLQLVLLGSKPERDACGLFVTHLGVCLAPSQMCA
jgi:hypothetical protein